MMQVAATFPELRGYVPASELQFAGPIATCRVQSSSSSGLYTAEWLDESRTSPELFALVRKQWRNNAKHQPKGSLRQHLLVDDDGVLARVVALPTGQPLRDWLLERRYSLSEALATAIEVSECLVQWHAMSLVHGWLNSHCLYRSDDGLIEIQDASLSNLHAEDDFLTLELADLAFLSPESSGSLAREIRSASDLYSVGVLLFTMIAGRLPIEASNASDYLNRQLCDEAPRLRELGLDVPKPLDDLVSRLLQRDPRDRYQTATALRYDLDWIAQCDTPNGRSTRFAIGTQDVRQAMTEPALVGRESDLAGAQRSMETACSGEFQLQIVTGSEPSCRRSFVDEIERIATSRSMIVLRSGTTTTTNPKPLQSIERVLATIAQLCAGDASLSSRLSLATTEHAATLAELLPDLASLWPTADQVTGPDAYGSQRAQIALEELFAALAHERGGVTILFDDLDSADVLTRNVVRSLIERAEQESGNSLFLMITCDSTASLPYTQNHSVRYLAPLTDEAMRLHLESSAGKLDDSIKHSIVEVAGGSPTRASAMLRRMMDSKAIRPTDEGWVAEGLLIDALRVDESFAELLERQVSELSSREVKVMATAAVVGVRFEMGVLANVAGVRYADALEVVTDALSRRLLWRDAQAGWLRFANDQIHQQLYMSLDSSQRQLLHQQTALYQEKQDPTNVFDLAFHYDAAGIGSAALKYALEAAQNARQRHSLSVAEDQLTIAKRWVSRHDLATGLLISEGLGEIHLLTGRYTTAAVFLAEALALAQTPLEKSRVRQQIGEVAFKRGRFVDAATEYEQALVTTGIHLPSNVVTMLVCLLFQVVRQVMHAALPRVLVARLGPPSELERLRLQLLSRLSRVYWFSRHRLWTLGNHLHSLNEAERYAPSETLAAIYSEHGPVMSLLRWFSRADQYIERSLQIRRDRGDVWGQGQSRHYQCVVKLAACQFQEAIDTSSTAVELLRQTGDFWEMNMARYQAANAQYRIGDLLGAVETASKMYHSGQEIGDVQATGISLDVWARSSPSTLPLELVKHEAALNRLDAQSHAQTQLAYAVVLLHHHRTNDAVEVLQEAIERCRLAGHLNTYISPAYAWLATAMRQRFEETDRRDGRRLQRRFKAARRAARQAYRISKAYPADRAHCLREIALLDAMQGKTDRSIRHLHRSLAVAIEFNQLVEQRDTLQILADLYQHEPERLGSFPKLQRARLDHLNECIQEVHRPLTESVSIPVNLSLADRFVTLLQSGRRIAQALTANGVYLQTSDSARRLLRAQHVDIALIRRHQTDVQFCCWSEARLDANGQCRIDANGALLQTAFDQGHAVCHAEQRPRGCTSSGSALAAPIVFRGEIVAMMLVSHTELQDLFGNDELRIAEFVTTLAGAALENADGFKQLQQMNDTLEQRVFERTQAAEERAIQLAERNDQLREIEGQLREAIKAANAANEAKSRFLATMSHEIRTPLNGILGMTRLAQQTSQDPRQTNYLDTVHESGQSLLTLINDLLDFSKLEAGKMELEQIPFGLDPLAGEISRLMAASAWQKGVELICDVASDVPDVVMGDPSRLRQIIVNLIGNAIKFTDNGFVAFRIQSRPVADLSVMISIEVQDSGVGIPADKQAKVFESFSQADSSTTRRYGGTGLGLAICRELAEMMGGSIELSSAVGLGSTFTVMIPMQIADPQTIQEFAAGQATEDNALVGIVNPGKPASPLTFGIEASARESRATRILVAEDGIINQEVIVGILEMEGYEVVVANDGEQAVQLASSGTYDLCLMDVDMPKMDGIDATKAIRKLPSESSRLLPIIAMTAHSGAQIWQDCSKAGMDGHLPKPIEPDTLFETIAHFAGKTTHASLSAERHSKRITEFSTTAFQTLAIPRHGSDE
ncbi:trifunctional serine/threonine-protein kinase/ATP-binding protein/hybrid sensor histidine kinase/response regulator [Novipirellula artificiosorum]|uniref:histidine kinase n=1 Tax=Novipirellula artificiosorum TaxID=2528016 RepID=A0A5C6DWJ4_9BACT|nr:trifunctional serine/threonine-protein kinase/ATP-binding protein/hybrid sensor histidine kinase/response regulator [Novipirellula artificiosorum]TWU41773.1 Sensory/regulatory protein RpfC [Novipirellula artificiosorum]